MHISIVLRYNLSHSYFNNITYPYGLNFSDNFNICNNICLSRKLYFGRFSFQKLKLFVREHYVDKQIFFTYI